MHGVLYPRSNVGWFYQARRDGGRGLLSIKDTMNREILLSISVKARNVKDARQRKEGDVVETPKKYEDKKEKKKERGWGMRWKGETWPI